MKKTFLKDYLPLLVVLVCAAVVGALLLTGTLDLDEIPALVQDNHALALAVVLALFVAKGFSGVILYNAIVIAVSLVFPLWEALLINGVGTAVALAISYCIGRRTNAEKLEALLNKNEKIKRLFQATQDYGFVFCFAVHLLGLSMEVLGILFGMLRVGFWTYLTSSWLAIIPGMICFAVMGSTFDLGNPVFWIVLAIDLALIAFGVFYTRRQLKSKQA